MRVMIPSSAMMTLGDRIKGIRKRDVVACAWSCSVGGRVLNG
jgi:hypothetical protein